MMGKVCIVGKTVFEGFWQALCQLGCCPKILLHINAAFHIFLGPSMKTLFPQFNCRALSQVCQDTVSAGEHPAAGRRGGGGRNQDSALISCLQICHVRAIWSRCRCFAGVPIAQTPCTTLHHAVFAAAATFSRNPTNINVTSRLAL